jgi:hypothetical protein
MTYKQPIGWIYEDDEGRITFSQMPQNPPFWEPVYKAAPKQWQSLTDDEEEQIIDAYWNDPAMFIEAIEAKLFRKNA